MFSSALDRDEALARSIEGDEELTMEALYDYVCGLLVLEPELSTVCDTMSGLVQCGLVSVGSGVSLTDEEWENPAKFFAGDYSLSLLATKSKGKKRKEVVDLRPTLETLLPLKPKFGIAAIIIREALSRKRGHNQTSATEVFRRMLDGNHPTTGMPTRFEPDQTNPIRADLTSFTLLKELLPLHQLTRRPAYLVFLHTWGLDRAPLPPNFLDRVRRRGQPMWHFSSAAACIGLFAEAERINTTLKAADRIEYDNPRCGSASWRTSPSWASVAVHDVSITGRTYTSSPLFGFSPPSSRFVRARPEPPLQPDRRSFYRRLRLHLVTTARFVTAFSFRQHRRWRIKKQIR
ncbi:hypothetical protein K438DRAFT_304366 [Mycena galopus ATCC 62051]|nr:hypothetical protein K438DRAFT_304366 [Mycena galopus ATCC 62051]